MKLICGLGNPGREYEPHRHNIGFRVIEELSARLKAPLQQEKFDGCVGIGQIKGEKILLVQPQTFMNLSGRCVVPLARFYKIDPQDVLVVHDELDLPFGKLQLKLGGGTGGHNGLKSISEQLGSSDYVRLRLGIDKPTGPNAKERVPSYVLSPFSGEENTHLPSFLGRAADACETWCTGGLQEAMNRHHRRG